jgi:shikimate kinase
MSEQVNEIKPFRQVPFCEPDAKLTITGAELEAIQSVVNAFTGPVNALQNIFKRNIDEGNIVIKYVQQDGTEITKEQATEYLKKAADFLKSNVTSQENQETKENTLN